MGFGQWSFPPPACQRRDAYTEDNFPSTLLKLCFVGYALFAVTFIVSLYLCHKTRKQNKILKSSAAEATPLLDRSEADSINKTEPTSKEATRKKDEPSAPPSNLVPASPLAPPAIIIIDGSETQDTIPKVPAAADSESSHRMACAVQETGGKPVHSPVGPLPPRKKEAFQPVDDDSGEKGLSPDLPSCAAGISRRLSYNQEEPQLGPEKVALEEQTVDRQDLGDR